jgi:hypothetical protein
MYSASPLSSGGNYTYLNAIAMGNLNDNSMMDMAAVYRQSNKIVVWLGQGNGTFNILVNRILPTHIPMICP